MQKTFQKMETSENQEYTLLKNSSEADYQQCTKYFMMT